eukprot:GGOE01002225.1.p1 GENE.GGOE01002225.1~~GGOE01002225.1.p1  ORF type:complete len:867 (+),score=312.07 GGOE01002225.1:54-2603(+)
MEEIQAKGLTEWTVSVDSVAQIEALATRVKAAPKLRGLTVEYDELTEEGLRLLLGALPTTKDRGFLSLALNHVKGQVADAQVLSATGAQLLAEHLNQSPTLQLLSIEGGDVGDEGVTHLAKALESNAVLKELSIRSSNVGPPGAEALAAMLRENKTLQTLDLEDNDIHHEGAIALAEGLKTNSSLKKLNLIANVVGPEGAVALAEMLKVNTTLKALNVERNEIGDAGTIALVESWVVRTALKELGMSGNDISTEASHRVDELLGKAARDKKKGDGAEGSAQDGEEGGGAGDGSGSSEGSEGSSDESGNGHSHGGSKGASSKDKDKEKKKKKKKTKQQPDGNPDEAAPVPSPAVPPVAAKKKATQPVDIAAAAPPLAEPAEATPPSPEPKPKPKQKQKVPKAEPAPEPVPEPVVNAEEVADAAVVAAEEEVVPDVPTKQKAKTKAAWSVEDHANVSKVIRFNFPIYGVHWFGTERLCIGGGGGQRYGMPNHVICATVKKGKAGTSFTVSAGYDSEQAIIWSLGTVHWTTKRVIVGHMDSISLLKLEFEKARISKLANLPVLSKDQQESRKYSAISPCGHLAVVAQDDCRLACVQVQDDKLLLRPDCLVGHEDRITDISLAAFPKEMLSEADRSVEGGAAAYALVATAAEDRSLRLWRVLITPKKGVKGVALIGQISTAAVRQDKCLFKFCRLDASGRLLYALSTGMGSASYITVFRLQPKKELAKGKKGDALGVSCILNQWMHHKVTNDSVTAFNLSHDARFVVCGDNEGVVYALRANDLQVVMRRKDLHDCPVTAIDINRSSELIASADLGAVVKVYPLGSPAGWPLTTVAVGMLILLVLLAAWLLLWR